MQEIINLASKLLEMRKAGTLLSLEGLKVAALLVAKVVELLESFKAQGAALAPCGGEGDDPNLDVLLERVAALGTAPSDAAAAAKAINWGGLLSKLLPLLLELFGELQRGE